MQLKSLKSLRKKTIQTTLSEKPPETKTEPERQAEIIPPSRKMEEKKAIKAKEAQASWHKRLFHLFGALLYLGVLIACAWNIIVVLIALIGALVDAMRRGYPRCIGWLMEIILGKERPPKQAKR